MEQTAPNAIEVIITKIQAQEQPTADDLANLGNLMQDYYSNKAVRTVTTECISILESPESSDNEDVRKDVLESLKVLGMFLSQRARV